MAVPSICDCKNSRSALNFMTPADKPSAPMCYDPTHARITADRVEVMLGRADAPSYSISSTRLASGFQTITRVASRDESAESYTPSAERTEWDEVSRI